MRQQQTVKKFMKQHSESSVLIFTDGSVCNGPVGSGACAVVVFPIGANEQIFTMTSAVGTKVNSLVCEINGIILALEMGIKCIHNCKNKKLSRVYMFSVIVSVLLIQLSAIQNLTDIQMCTKNYSLQRHAAQ